MFQHDRETVFVPDFRHPRDEGIFVLVVERDPQGGQRILEWGQRTLGELAAWMVVGRDQQEGEEK